MDIFYQDVDMDALATDYEPQPMWEVVQHVHVALLELCCRDKFSWAEEMSDAGSSVASCSDVGVCDSPNVKLLSLQGVEQRQQQPVAPTAPAAAPFSQDERVTVLEQGCLSAASDGVAADRDRAQDLSILCFFFLPAGLLCRVA